MTTKQTRKLQQATRGNGHAVGSTQPATSVSQESLDLLVEGRDALLQQRQQLAQQLQQLDARIQRQEGGIQLMQMLLEGQAQVGAAVLNGNGDGEEA